MYQRWAHEVKLATYLCLFLCVNTQQYMLLQVQHTFLPLGGFSSYGNDTLCMPNRHGGLLSSLKVLTHFYGLMWEDF